MTRMRVFSQSRYGPSSYAAHNGAVTCMALSSDGRVLVTGGEDGLVRFWSAEGVGLLDQLTLPTMGLDYGYQSHHMFDDRRFGVLPQFVTALDWSPSGKRLLAARGGYVVVIGATGRTPLRWIGPQTGTVWGARWLSEYDNQIGTVCMDGYQRNWEATFGKRVEKPAREINLLDLDRPWSLVPCRNAFTAFIGGHGGGLILTTFMSHPVELKTPTSAIEAAGWSSDEDHVYTVDYDGRLRVFDRLGLCVTPTVQLHNQPARCMAKPYRSGLAGTGDQIGDILVWHEGDPTRILARLQGHAGAVRCLAAPAGFDRLYSGGDDGTVREWTDLPIAEQMRRWRAEVNRPAAITEGDRNLEV